MHKTLDKDSHISEKKISKNIWISWDPHQYYSLKYRINFISPQISVLFHCQICVLACAVPVLLIPVQMYYNCHAGKTANKD